MREPLHDGNINEYTPLHLAVLNGNVKVLKALLGMRGYTNIEINAKDIRGQAALQLAVIMGDLEAVQALLLKCSQRSLSAKNQNGNTLFHLAVISGNVEVLKALLASRIQRSPNAKNQNGQAALHLAVIMGNLEAVKALLAKDAWVYAKDINLDTPLHLAVVSGNEEIVQALLEKGARIDARNQDGQTALQLTVFGNPIIQRTHADQTYADGRLLNEKEAAGLIRAKPNIPIVLPKMAEHLIKSAIVRNMHQPSLVASHPKLRKCWSKCVNDKRNKAESSFTVHDMEETSEEMMIDVVSDGNVLMNMDQHLTDTNIINAAANGYIEVVKYLIKQGADVNAQDKDGKTALHYAAANGHVDAVKCLIEQGVEVNAAESKNRRTALHYAVANGSLELLRYLLENLLEKGSDVDVKDKHGISPLRYAVAKGNSAVVSILLKYGADIEVLDRCARLAYNALLTTEIEPYFTHPNITNAAKQTARS